MATPTAASNINNRSLVPPALQPWLPVPSSYFCLYYNQTPINGEKSPVSASDMQPLLQALSNSVEKVCQQQNSTSEIPEIVFFLRKISSNNISALPSLKIEVLSLLVKCLECLLRQNTKTLIDINNEWIREIESTFELPVFTVIPEWTKHELSSEDVKTLESSVQSLVAQVLGLNKNLVPLPVINILHTLRQWSSLSATTVPGSGCVQEWKQVQNFVLSVILTQEQKEDNIPELMSLFSELQTLPFNQARLLFISNGLSLRQWTLRSVGLVHFVSKAQEIHEMDLVFAEIENEFPSIKALRLEQMTKLCLKFPTSDFTKIQRDRLILLLSNEKHHERILCVAIKCLYFLPDLTNVSEALEKLVTSSDIKVLQASIQLHEKLSRTTDLSLDCLARYKRLAIKVSARDVVTISTKFAKYYIRILVNQASRESLTSNYTLQLLGWLQHFKNPVIAKLIISGLKSLNSSSEYKRVLAESIAVFGLRTYSQVEWHASVLSFLKWLVLDNTTTRALVSNSSITIRNNCDKLLSALEVTDRRFITVCQIRFQFYNDNDDSSFMNNRVLQSFSIKLKVALAASKVGLFTVAKNILDSCEGDEDLKDFYESLKLLLSAEECLSSSNSSRDTNVAINSLHKCRLLLSFSEFQKTYVGLRLAFSIAWLNLSQLCGTALISLTEWTTMQAQRCYNELLDISLQYERFIDCSRFTCDSQTLRMLQYQKFGCQAISEAISMVFYLHTNDISIHNESENHLCYTLKQLKAALRDKEQSPVSVFQYFLAHIKSFRLGALPPALFRKQRKGLTAQARLTSEEKLLKLSPYHRIDKSCDIFLKAGCDFSGRLDTVVTNILGKTNLAVAATVEIELNLWNGERVIASLPLIEAQLNDSSKVNHRDQILVRSPVLIPGTAFEKGTHTVTGSAVVVVSSTRFRIENLLKQTIVVYS